MKPIPIHITRNDNRWLLRLLCGILMLVVQQAAGMNAPVLTIEPGTRQQEYALSPHLEVLRLPRGTDVKTLTLEDIRAKNGTGNFKPFSADEPDARLPVHWFRFVLRNQDPENEEFKLSIIFTDHIQFYFPDANGRYQLKKAGDLETLREREVKVGQLCFTRFKVPYGRTVVCYLRVESQTDISQQFKGPALRSVKVYPDPGFIARFETSRIYQAMFFGALLIMLFYNLAIYVTLRHVSYLLFCFFIFTLCLFTASDRGYLFELVLPQYPRLDLYIRFLSAPLLATAYVQFSRAFLQTGRYMRTTDRALRWLPLLFIALSVLMMAGYWKLGRTLTICCTLLGLLIILSVAIRSLLKGYTPARYFVAANLLFLVGSITMVYQRMHYSQHVLSQYSLQIAALAQVAFFSMGLTNRIQLMQRRLAAQVLEKQRLEKEAALERERLIEEKNRELEWKVKQRTAEVLAQKEEIETQNEKLAQVNEELITTQEIIATQNKELAQANQVLETTVKDRTWELYVSNEKLRTAIHELDSFIYRTAHDIRGPLARLMGLCNIATMDVKETAALHYLEKLNWQAHNLDYILSRLSTVYEINHSAIRPQPIDFDKLLWELKSKLLFIEGFEQIRFAAEVQPGIRCHSDYELLLFIVRNLLENAVKFQRTASADRYVGLSMGTRNNHLVIHVRDNGIGISPEEADLIFDMFSRAASKHRSTGMGLYMVKKAVEKLQGSIALVDHPEGLTDFRIEIPLQTKLGPEPSQHFYPKLHS